MVPSSRPPQGPDNALAFDRAAVRAHRTRSASHLDAHDFLYREITERLLDRLDDVKRRFPLALDLGSHGLVRPMLRGRGGIEWLIECAPVTAIAARRTPPLALVADEEWLPIKDGSLDLVLSVLSLHWVNDLPGALAQIRRALKPDGLFLAALFGGATLTELRSAWLSAEAAREGGVSPRVAPVIDVPDAAALLQRTGFALPVVDTDRITVTYANALQLMRELRAMGESNATQGRRRGATRRATLFAAVESYQAQFGGPDGRIPATFQTLYLTGWSPHESQPKGRRPGIGQTGPVIRF
jgi:SAM-dependent methyltransferase